MDRTNRLSDNADAVTEPHWFASSHSDGMREPRWRYRSGLAAMLVPRLASTLLGLNITGNAESGTTCYSSRANFASRGGNVP